MKCSRLSVVTITLILLILCCCGTILSSAKPSLISVGVFSFSGNPSGTVNQQVTLEVKRHREKYALTLSIVWEPGVAINVDCEATLLKLDSNVLDINFTDSFGNRCKGKAVFNDNRVNIDLEVVDVMESRAARQYGDYSLKKIN